MERFVAVVKQYPGQQQVDLAVEIEVPGSWFGAGPMGSLTVTEQREKYKAQAVEYAEVHEFPGASKGARKTREKAIRFICITDATEEPNSEGYWMKLSQWNRYRNDTFKDRREDELAFIPGEAPATEGGVVEKLKAPQTPLIKTVFTLKSIFDLSVFWSGQKSVIPVHYSLWMAEVGCAKVASANVETVFSGAGRISMKSHCLGPQILSDYAFLHYNYKYDWLRPTLEEIVDAYTKLYGKELRESDIETDGSESSTTEEVEEDGDED